MGARATAIPTTLAHGAVPVALRAEAKPVGPVRRRELLQALRSGEEIAPLEVDIVPFLQRPTPNRNYVRFDEKILKSFAASFVGAPFIRDHAQDDLLARAGTVLSSQLIRLDDGTPAFQQTVEVVTPWAAEAVLRGLMDRFSIGWSPTGDVLCTLCGKHAFELFSSRPREERCLDHWPGQTYDGKAAEILFTSAEGVEVSAVTVPAVEGTEVERVHAALSAQRQAWSASSPSKETTTMKNVLKVLGLSEDAAESAALAEIERRDILLAGEREAHKAARAELEQVRARLEAQEIAQLAARKSALTERALAEGRYEKGSPLEQRIQALMEIDLELAEKAVDGLPPRLPIGKPLLSATPDPTPRSDSAVNPSSPVFSHLGLSAEDLQKYGPKAGA